MATTYYHYDQVYDRRNVGYAGPRFSYASMPDQYTLAALQRLELEQPNRPPSWPRSTWSPATPPGRRCPRLVDWSRVGDGSVFDPMPAEGESPEEVWRDPDLVKAAYAESVAYSLDAVTSFVQQLHDQDLVLVVLGDHQPASIVSGEGVSHDVPVSIIAADPAVAGSAHDAERLRTVRRLRDELRRIHRRDYFPPTERDTARLAVENLAGPRTKADSPKITP